MSEPVDISKRKRDQARDAAMKALKAVGVLEEREGQEENAEAVEYLARLVLDGGVLWAG